MTEMVLGIEELEPRIAPSLCIVPGLASAAAWANHGSTVIATAPVSPDGFPSIVNAGQLGPWLAHFSSPVVDGPTCE